MATFLSCAASTAFADMQASPSETNASGSKMDKKTVDARLDAQAIVCRREDTTGSRLGATKVCHTRAEWAAMAAEAREQVNRIQTTPQTH